MAKNDNKKEVGRGEDKASLAGAKSSKKVAGETGAGASHDHGHHSVDRRPIWVIFGVLFVLTVLEVGVAKLPGISHTLMAVALVGLAITKASCVGLYYMHLKHEAKILRASVAIPFAAPVVYALVLISDAAWRLTR